MVDSMGAPLHNVMLSMGTDSVTGWNTVCYTGHHGMTKQVSLYITYNPGRDVPSFIDNMSMVPNIFSVACLNKFVY